MSVEKSQLAQEIAQVLNCHSLENVSNTPDFILAEYLVACLAAFDAAVQHRDGWYGISPEPGASTEDRPAG